jgi:CubicO group peptidase (beta-lactamase class C family)
MIAIFRIAFFRVCGIGVAGLLFASCTTEPTTDREPAEKPALDSKYYPPEPGEGKWQTITPTEAGFDPAGIEEMLRYAEAQRSSGVVALFDGRILAERYWQVPEAEGSRYQNMVAGETADGRAIEDVASVQKNVVSLLAGIAEGKGLLDLAAPVSFYLGEGWSKAATDQEAAITIEHVMSMTSGLSIDRTFEVPAGQKWRYNTNVYSRMLPVLEAVSGLSVDEYTVQWLTAPIGMSDSSWVPRPWITSGQDANVVGFGSTARDLARLGLLVLRGGKWNGIDILGNPGYIKRSTSSSQQLNPAYGYLWWLNGQERYLKGRGDVFEGQLIPSAPNDLYFASGALGRKCYVVPSMMLVVTRLGDEPESDFDEELWRRLMAAAHK